MIKFVLNRGLSRPLFYSRVPAMEHLRIVLISVKNMRRRTENKRTQDVENNVFLECCHFSKGIFLWLIMHFPQFNKNCGVIGICQRLDFYVIDTILVVWKQHMVYRSSEQRVKFGWPRSTCKRKI